MILMYFQAALNSPFHSLRINIQLFITSQHLQDLRLCSHFRGQHGQTRPILSSTLDMTAASLRHSRELHLIPYYPALLDKKY